MTSDREQAPGDGPRFPAWVLAVNGWLNLKRIRLYSLATCLVLFMVWAGWFFATRSLQTVKGMPIGADYYCFYMAGELVRTGEADKLYDLEYTEEWQEEFKERPLWKKHWDGFIPYFNPPHFAWLLSAITRLGFLGSLAVWWALMLGCFALSALFWRQWLDGEDCRIALALSICAPVFYFAFAAGQNSFLTLMLLTGFCAMLIRGEDFAAGLMLALLSYKPQYAIVPFLFLLLRKRWKAVGGLIAGGIAILIFTWLTAGPELIGEFARFGAAVGVEQDAVVFPYMIEHSAPWLFQQLAGGKLPAAWFKPLSVIVTLALLALGWLICRNKSEDDSPLFMLQLSAMLVVTLATLPHLITYDVLVTLLPAVLWWAARAKSSILPEWDPGFRTLLFIGFLWLFIGQLLALALPLQLTPLLMVLWLLLIRGAVPSLEAEAGR